MYEIDKPTFVFSLSLSFSHKDRSDHPAAAADRNLSRLDTEKRTPRGEEPASPNSESHHHMMEKWNCVYPGMYILGITLGREREEIPGWGGEDYDFLGITLGRERVCSDLFTYATSVSFYSLLLWNYDDSKDIKEEEEEEETEGTGT